MSFAYRPRPAWLGLAFCLAALVGAAPARAQSPSATATVTVRVVGLNGLSLLPQTTVTTNATPVHSGTDTTDTCPGTSLLGALADATGGGWGGVYDSGLGYEVDTIEGLTFPAGFTGDAYWAIWLNDTYASEGACSQALANGDDIVFFAQCQAIGPDCTSATAPDHFLTETAPSEGVVQVGTPVTVTVGSVGTGTGAPEALPTGVTVSAGAVTAPVSAQGTATLTFATAGTYTLVATAPDAVPSDPHTVCVHNGNDGNCGTTAPTGPAPATTTVSTSTSSTASAGVQGTTTKVPTSTPVALAAFATGVINSHVYARGHAPRTLAGHVTVEGTLQSVRIRLERDDDGRCSDYDATTERFRASRCGIDRARFFKVGDRATFSYLLPAALGRGRYVFDVEAVDSSGEVSGLYHGTSRIVFYVR